MLIEACWCCFFLGRGVLQQVFVRQDTGSTETQQKGPLNDYTRHRPAASRHGEKFTPTSA